jgi:hypothetical protein
MHQILSWWGTKGISPVSLLPLGTIDSCQ